jgi:hypothetical protein
MSRETIVFTCLVDATKNEVCWEKREVEIPDFKLKQMLKYASETLKRKKIRKKAVFSIPGVEVPSNAISFYFGDNWADEIRIGRILYEDEIKQLLKKKTEEVAVVNSKEWKERSRAVGQLRKMLKLIDDADACGVILRRNGTFEPYYWQKVMDLVSDSESLKRIEGF